MICWTRSTKVDKFLVKVDPLNTIFMADGDYLGEAFSNLTMKSAEQLFSLAESFLFERFYTAIPRLIA